MRIMLTMGNIVLIIISDMAHTHFGHSAHTVYKIYSVFKLFEFAVCSAHFEFFEITTPVMRIMLAMANIA